MKKLLTTLFALATVQISFGQTILSEDFEGGSFPSGWSQTTNATDSGWLVGIASALESANFPITDHTNIIGTNDDGCDCDKSNDLLISPTMDFTGLTNVFLSFDCFYYELSYNGATENATIEASTDGGTTWNIVSDLDANTGDWQTRYADLSAYGNMTNVLVGFRYNDGGDWLYGWAMDNVSVFAPTPGLDASVTNVLVGKEDPTPSFVGFVKYLTALPLSVATTIGNNGTIDITSFDFTWTDGTNTFNQSVSGINIGPLESYSLIATDPYMTLSGNQTIDLDITSVNGGASELSVLNNSGSFSVEGVTPHPDRKYLAEEGTGTWCGWCPRGTVFMEYMNETYPDQFVGIAVHNGDPMKLTEYDNAISGMIPGYPSVVINRLNDIDPSQLEADFINKITSAPVVKITGDAMVYVNTGQITVNVSGEFLQSLNGDYRFAAIVVEDSVHGTTSQYAQTNYYAGGSNGPMAGFELLGGTVPASQMYYDFVGRALIGGFDGASGSLPSSINSGSTYDYQFVSSVSSSWNYDRLSVVLVVLKNSTGEAMNVNEVPVTLNVGIDNPTTVAYSLFVYPNPSSDVAYLDLSLTQAVPVTIDVFNSIGQLVATKEYGTLDGEQLIQFNTTLLSSGMYNLILRAGDQTLTKKLVVSK